MTNLTILNSSIRTLDNLYSLNDLHRLSGAESKHQPNRFMRLETTQELISEIDSSQTPDLAFGKISNKKDRSTKTIFAIKTIRGGKDISIQGTWACEELALAYATWISPKFHLVVLRAFIAMHKGEVQNTAPKLPLVNPMAEEEILALLTHSFHFCSLAHEMAQKLKQARLQDKIDTAIGGQYLYNFNFPLEQHLANVKRYIQAKQERLMYVKGMLNLLDIEQPQTQRLPHTTF